MSTNMVSFDTKELAQKASDAGMTLTDLSIKAGMSRDYLSHAIRMGLINLNVLTKMYEILGQRPAAPERKARQVSRHISRRHISINGQHCREIIIHKGWYIKDVAGMLKVTDSAVATWLRKDYLPENLLPELAELLEITEEEILTGWPPIETEQLELDFEEPEGGPFYTADDVKDMMRKFIDDFSDCVMDYLGNAIDGYKKEAE